MELKALYCTKYYFLFLDTVLKRLISSSNTYLYQEETPPVFDQLI